MGAGLDSDRSNLHVRTRQPAHASMPDTVCWQALSGVYGNENPRRRKPALVTRAPSEAHSVVHGIGHAFAGSEAVDDVKERSASITQAEQQPIRRWEEEVRSLAIPRLHSGLQPPRRTLY